MSVADMARALATHCEVKKDKLRQTQSGDWALGFTVAKGDLPAVVRDASPGQRFMLALVPIDDDEMPLGGEDNPVAADGDAVPPTAAPARRRWSEMTRSERAGIRCQEAEFCRWLWAKNDMKWEDAMGDAAEAVRILCNVVSRTEFDTDAEAAARWDALEARFMQATGRMAVDR